MANWKNMGDISPKEGTWLLRDAKIEGDSFTAQVINIMPETHVGGSDRIFDIGQGDLFLDRKDLAAALKTIGNGLRGPVIVAPDHNGGEREIHPGTEEYLTEIAHAVMAYSGPEYDRSTLVGIGIPSVYDQDAKFPGDPVLYAYGTSLWDIVGDVCNGVEKIENGTETVIPQQVQAYDDIDSPYAGCPRELRTMSDLVKIKAFAELEKDANGNPKVWRHEYRTPDGIVEELSAFEDCDLELEGETYISANTTWVGPKESDLIEAWESLCDTIDPEPASAPTP